MKYLCLALPVFLLFFCGFSIAPSEKIYLPPKDRCRVILLSDGTERAQKAVDAPLTETAKQEALAFAKKLAHLKVQKIYSADLARSLETAKILAAAHHVEVIKDPALQFLSNRRWFHHLYFPQKKEELRQKDLREGVLAYVKKIAEDHLGEIVFVVAHQSALKSLRVFLGGAVYSDMQRLSIQDTVSVLGNGHILALEN